MSRRRNLRLPSSSDEDEPPPEPQTLGSNPNPNSYPVPSSPPPSPPLEISDDEQDAVFVDVPEEFSPSSPPNPNPNPGPNRSSNVDQIDGVLGRLGLKLRREWLESCVGGLERSGVGFGRLDVDSKAKLCLEQFLVADMNSCGAGVLPANVGAMHKVELEGPFVLQVDELINMCAPLRERYHSASAGFKRCLKLSLTDGIQRVFGMEYRPIRDLDACGPAGLKIVVRNVNVRRGLLLLVPEVMDVLGGMVEDLEAARQRLVHEIDKPPRGKRKQGNSALPLAKRATLAAWQSASSVSYARQPSTSEPQSSYNRQPTTQAIAYSCSRSSAGASSNGDFSDLRDRRNSTTEHAVPAIDENIAEEFFAACHRNQTVHGPPPSNRTETVAAIINSSTGIAEVSAIQEYDAVPRSNTMELASRGIQGSTVSQFVAPHVPESVSEEPTVSSRVETSPDSAIQSPGSIEYSNALLEEYRVGEAEHPLILHGDKELPFTYLACMLAKWTIQRDRAPSIQGKVKCTLTGVKGFQFRDRSTYDLHVYIDDGSLISEVIIDHHVVEKVIGHSPEEVTAALASSDKQTAADMKETLKNFQLFLIKFEGPILMEMNENSTFPIVLEMNQGSSTSDAWMLLQRLKKFTAPQNFPHSHLDPIDLSP